MLKNLKQDLLKLKNPEKIKVYQWFFKTGPGEYGEGDVFFGIKMGDQRTVAKKYIELKLSDIQKLLDSKVHEYRMVALLILVYKYKKADEKLKRQIYNFYIKNSKKINNWDLVDVTAPHIVGNYLLDKDRKILYKFAHSNNLWKKRISIISTATFIREDDFADTIKISKILLNDKHDLIHKAVGWMLREVGKKDEKLLEKLLEKFRHEMPRTMLRYSIERLPEKKRKYYLHKK